MADENPALPPSTFFTITEALKAYNTAAKTGTRTIMEQMVGQLNEMMVDPQYNERQRAMVSDALLRPAAYGIEQEVPPDIREAAATAIIGTAMLDLNPEEFRPAQKATFRRLRRITQHLYNEKVSRSPADRADYSKERKTLLLRIYQAILEGHPPPSDDIMVLDAIDHPEKYGMRVASEPVPPGRPKKAAPVRGRPPTTETKRTVTKRTEIPAEVSVPVTRARGRPARKGIPAPEVNPLPTGGVPAPPPSSMVTPYVALGENLKRTSAREYARFITILQGALISPAISETDKRIVAEGLRQLGEVPETTEMAKVDVKAYLSRGQQGATELYSLLESLARRPTPRNAAVLNDALAQLGTLASEPGGFLASGVMSRLRSVPPPAAPSAPPVEKAPPPEAAVPAAEQPVRPVAMRRKEEVLPPIVPVPQIPENMEPALKERILKLDEIRRTNRVAWTASVQMLLNDVVKAYSADPSTYMGTDAARILTAFQVGIQPSFLNMIVQ